MTAVLDEVTALRNQLVKLMESLPLDNKPTLDLLNRLGTHAITYDMLKKTGIGKHVNMVRKKDGANAEVKVLAKKLAKEYKATTDAGAGGSTASVARKDSTDSTAAKRSQSDPMRRTSSGAARPATMPVPLTGNGARDACRRMLCNNALCVGGSTHSYAPEASANIESALFAKHGMNTNKEYQKAIKTRVFNLKGNANLRNSVLAGELSGAQVANMTTEEMMNEAAKDAQKKAADAMMLEKEMAYKQGARTTEFQCGKCKKRDVSYTQAQTRSADEPMTTFCACNICGNRWKFC